MRRTLVRIAHEIVEKNAEPDALALVGIHRRGAILAARLQDLLADLLEPDVPLGDLDISFYRDDLGRRADAPSSTPPTSTSTSTAAPSSSSTTSSTPAARCARRSRRSSTTAARQHPARRPGRPRPPRAPVPARLRRQEPPDLQAERVNVRVEELDGVDEVAITAPRRLPHEAPALHRGPRARGHRAHPRPGHRLRGVADREIKKVPALRGRTVLNLFYEASTRTRSSFELAAKRLSADVVNFAASGSSVEKGESLKDTVLTLGAHSPTRSSSAAPGRRRRAGRGAGRPPRSSTPATASTSTRRRPCSTSTRCARASAASTAEHLDRRRRPALARRALEHPRLPEDGRAGHGLRPADAHPARHRGARLRRALHPRRPARGRRRLRPADAARAHGPGLRAVAARVRRRVPDQRPPPAPAPGAHAPRPGQPRGRALRRGRRLAPGGHHRSGRGRRRRPHGRPLRGPGRRTAPRARRPARAREKAPA